MRSSLACSRKGETCRGLLGVVVGFGERGQFSDGNSSCFLPRNNRTCLRYARRPEEEAAGHHGEERISVFPPCKTVFSPSDSVWLSRRSAPRPPWAVEDDPGLRTQDIEGIKDDRGRPIENIMPPRDAYDPARAAGEGKRRSKDPQVWEPPSKPPPPSSRAERLHSAEQRRRQQQQQQQQRHQKQVHVRDAAEIRNRTPAASDVRKAAATRPTAGTSPGETEFATINPQRVYVGDRAKIKGTPRVGEVMYVGPADFARGTKVVGLKLQHKRTTSMCDGKYQGERYFRCQPGYGQYVPLADVEVLENDPLYEPPAPPSSAESARSGTNEQVQSGPNYRLEKDLRQIIGLSKAKDALVSIRNSVEVRKRRQNVGVQENVSMHAVNVVLGNAGTGKSSVAGVLARMLHSLGELERDTVLEVDRKDLTSSGYHEEDDPCVDVIRRARGGVLLINDAHLLIDDKRSSDSSGTKAIHTLARECESGRNQTVLVLAGPRAEMEKFLNGGGAPLKRLVTNTLDFPDLSAEECAQVTKRVAQSKGFQLASGLADSGALAEV